MSDAPTSLLRPVPCTRCGTPKILEGERLAGHEKYLSDESRRTGRADAIALPATTEEVCAAVLAAGARGWAVTVSAARTGIAAGAVPYGGLLLSLERLNRIRAMRVADNGDVLLRCEAGVTLNDVRDAVRTGSFPDQASWDEESRRALRHLRDGRFFYPPDPTETGAAIGGTVACNASGAHTFLYGPTRPYVHALRVVLADGRILDLERGACRADADGFLAIEQPDGAVRRERVPAYRWPSTKNSGGYYPGPETDPVDLFIGSEGTLGIVTEAVVRLVPAPATSCAVMTFHPSEASALDFTRALRDRRHELGVEAIEYFGPRALAMLRQRRRALGAVSGVPECLPDDADCAIYLDVGTTPEALPASLDAVARAVADSGGDPDRCWSAAERDERERLRIFRHSLPETVNARIAEIRRTHPTITKLGTDMAVPDHCLEEILRVYRSGLAEAGLDYVIFGHIGNSHLHVNILPSTPEEYERGRELYHRFAETVVAMGGSPAAEHGIGKLKRDFLVTLYGAEGVRSMKAVKALFDPDGRLGPGTLFE